MKKQITIRPEVATIDIIEYISEINDIPKCVALDLMAQLIDTYFTKEQLILEAQMMRREDGRTTRWQKESVI